MSGSTAERHGDCSVSLELEREYEAVLCLHTSPRREVNPAMATALFLAERTAEGIQLQVVEWEGLRREEGTMGVAVAGAGSPEALAREAATLHFERQPDRRRAWIVVTSGASPSTKP
jgi:hypothetical protein